MISLMVIEKYPLYYIVTQKGKARDNEVMLYHDIPKVDKQIDDAMSTSVLMYFLTPVQK